ncbi:MAG: hypothetical protein PF450_07390 [Bacteroidales bacterium]|jgi:hypothetical protein|nr:hypothetical protein [Bacteroidales bacterium]
MKNQASSIQKLVLVLALFLFSFNKLPAQETASRNALYINTGATIPYAQFAEKSFGYQTGFALLGVNLDADYIRFGKMGIFGLYANLGYSNVFFAKKRYISEYERILGDEGAMIVTAGSYQFLSGEGGFVIRFAEFKNTRIVFQAGIGYTLCRQPYLSASHSYWGDLNTVNADVDVQLSSGTGIKVDYALNERTGIHFSYSLHACLPGFMDTEGYWEHYYNLPVRYQNINFGITRYF